MLEIKMLRLIDCLFAFFGLLFGMPVFLIIYLFGWFDTGAPLFTQKRVGYHKKTFVLVKFRTMTVGTESVATHLASTSSITWWGGVLRKTKLDELPQLWNVLKGDMSFVGPRPNLLSQKELIFAREKLGVYDVLPGITGLAQVSGVDMSNPAKLATLDAEMIKTMSLKHYFKYILMTLVGHGQGDKVKSL